MRSLLYTLARLMGDISALLSLTKGNTKPIVRRAKNKVVGRLIGKTGVWR